jgi:hypothetical protein
MCGFVVKCAVLSHLRVRTRKQNKSRGKPLLDLRSLIGETTSMGRRRCLIEPGFVSGTAGALVSIVPSNTIHTSRGSCTMSTTLDPGSWTQVFENFSAQDRRQLLSDDLEAGKNVSRILLSIVALGTLMMIATVLLVI